MQVQLESIHVHLSLYRQCRHPYHSMKCISYLLYPLLRHEIKTVQITFYFNILFKSQSHPPRYPPYPPAMYLSQPVKTVKQFVNDLRTPPTKTPLHSHISYVHPVGLSPYSTCKLDIPGLESHSPCMNGQQVGILHQAHHVVFCCFVESLESTLGPSHWALDNCTTFIIDI